MLFFPIIISYSQFKVVNRSNYLSLSDSIYLKDIENSLLLLVHWRCLSLLIGLHGREEQHFLDAVGVREQHGQSVDTDTPAAGGRKSVLEGLHEVLVDCLCLNITCVLSLGLISEQIELDLRVVKLGVSINKLMIVAE